MFVTYFTYILQFLSGCVKQHTFYLVKNNSVSHLNTYITQLNAQALFFMNIWVCG